MYWTITAGMAKHRAMTVSTPADGDLDLLNRLGRLDACAASDALDFLSLAGATSGIRPLWPAKNIVGRAVTVQAAPRTEDKPVHHLNAPAIDSGGPQDVLVVANDGRLDVSCWGDIVSHAARSRGIRGVVIDGACRDIEASARIEFPVYGRAVVPISARGRIVQRSYNEPIEVAGVRVDPGDYVVADASGVVFIPAPRLAEVVELGERIMDGERSMIEAVSGGAAVTEVMHDSRFQALRQTS